ncbi:hypothetical protein BYT27DRAFT_6683544 [Phlegmacium glaucopus]|nr:hypothetical protein BYT27DRAFT_6683544 [Phlegmacium glaucopus]
MQPWSLTTSLSISKWPGSCRVPVTWGTLWSHKWIIRTRFGGTRQQRKFKNEPLRNATFNFTKRRGIVGEKSSGIRSLRRTDLMRHVKEGNLSCLLIDMVN